MSSKEAALTEEDSEDLLDLNVVSSDQLDEKLQVVARIAHKFKDSNFNITYASAALNAYEDFALKSMSRISAINLVTLPHLKQMRITYSQIHDFFEFKVLIK
jgi:hypothetical protein